MATTPARTTCFGSFIVHLPAKQKLVKHFLGTYSYGVLLVLFSLERDALKACRHVDDQVLSIMAFMPQALQDQSLDKYVGSPGLARLKSSRESVFL